MCGSCHLGLVARHPISLANITACHDIPTLFRSPKRHPPCTRSHSCGMFHLSSQEPTSQLQWADCPPPPPASLLGDEAGAIFQEVASCHLKLSSAHEAASAYSNAAQCYKKTNPDRALTPIHVA